MITYSNTTRDITIRVRPVYLDEVSDFINRKFEFGYLVLVRNDGDSGVKLLRQTWTIHESDGSVQESESDPDRGAAAILHPGDTRVFDGRCTLSTFAGHAEGSYLMQQSNGDRFRVSVPRVPLQAAAN